MKKTIILTLMLAILTVGLNTLKASENKDVIGEWKWEVPTAPWGKDKGEMIFFEKEGKLLGELNFDDGSKIPLNKVTYTENKLKCEVTVDYELVSIEINIDGKKMTGTADTSEGKMNLKAIKIE